MKRMLLALSVAGLIVLFMSTISSAQTVKFPYCAAGEQPSLQAGFKYLAEVGSFDYGQLLECEHTNPVNGDALQITSKGMFVYQKSSNEPRYTDGYNSCAWNTNGLNAWQCDRQGPASAPSAPVATETPVSKEVPWQQITTTSWETYNPDGSVSGKFFTCLFNESGQPAAYFLHVEARGGT